MDPDAAHNEEPDEVEHIDPNMLTKTMRSNLFFAYMDALLGLHRCVEKIGAWSEGCYCHEFMAGERISGTSAYYDTRDFDTFKGCAVKCMRAPECAAGEIMNMFEERVRRAKLHLATNSQPFLSQDEWAEIMKMLDSGIALIRGILSVKVSFWQELPWILCGLAHFREEVARSCCALAVSLWDKIPVHGRHLAHNVARNFLDGPYRAELDAFVAGASRSNWSTALKIMVAILAFIPVAERIIEAQHRFIKKDSAAAINVGPVAASLSLRCNAVLEELIARDASSLDRFVQCFEEVRHIRTGVHVIGLTQHPHIRPLTRDMQTSKWVTHVSAALYHADLESEFQPMETQKRWAKSHQEARKRKADKIAPARAPELRGFARVKVLWRGVAQ